MTIESVKENWSKAVDMKGAKHVEKIAEVTLNLVEKLQVSNIFLLEILLIHIINLSKRIEIK